MDGLALHVAKIARRRHPMHVLLEEVNGYFAEMGRLAVDLGNSTQKALLSADPEKAAQIAGDDDAMDNLHRHLFTVLMDDEWKHGVAAAVDVTLLGRFYERFADHPVEVSRRIIFQATGHGPDDDSLRAPTQCLPPPGHPRRTKRQTPSIVDTYTSRPSSRHVFTHALVGSGTPR